MSTSIRGVGSLTRVASQELVNDATALLGQKPLFWGRYFSGADWRGEGEYFRRVENNTLRKNDIRVLPIGRYTTRVGGGQAQGQEDGRDQANDFIVTFGEEYLKAQGEEFYFFLDVELTNPLSAAYYLGWSKAVQSVRSKVRLLPCVYMNVADQASSKALNEAIKQGAKCHGLWMARYDDRSRKPKCDNVPFDKAKVQCQPPVTVPILFWQYAGDMGKAGGFDLNVSNPDSIDQQTFLKRFVLPQQVS